MCEEHFCKPQGDMPPLGNKKYTDTDQICPNIYINKMYILSRLNKAAQQDNKVTLQNAANPCISIKGFWDIYDNRKVQI